MTSIERWIVEILVGAALLGGAILYLEHRGALRIEKSDAKALVADQKRVDAETTLAAEKAKKADLGAVHDQAVVDNYRATHDDGPVSVCHQNNSIGQVPAPSPAVGRIKSPGAGPAVIPEVPTGIPGPDIRPNLDAIVRAAETVDILYRDRQSR